MIMTTVFRGLCLLSWFLFGALPGRGADTDPLPIDPTVTFRKLPNGLTYYIRANKKPENRAQFHLVINAGSIL